MYFYSIIFLEWPKDGHDVISHITRAFSVDYFSSFLEYIFRHKFASFCRFSLQIFTPYFLCVKTQYFIFKAEEKENRARIGVPDENIVQNHLNIALLIVF